MYLVCLVLIAAVQSSGQPAGQSAPSAIKSTSQEVLLDVIVRDKKGKPVRDLEQSQFRITENGEPVQIASFRLVEENGSEAARPESGATPLDPTKQISLVTLVFERLGPDGRLFARRAALDLLKNQVGQNLYYAVFSIDHRLSVLQQFTNDRAALSRAVTFATGGTPAQFASQSDNIKRTLQGLRVSSDGALAAVSANGGAARDISTGLGPEAATEREFAKITQSMLDFSESAAHTEEGRSSIFSLMAIAKEQYALPGIKTLIYFSEGLEVPNNLALQLHSMIAEANRANVHIYAVDARGLLVAAQNLKAKEVLSDTMTSADAEMTTIIPDHGDEQQNKVTPGRAKVLEHGEDSIRANVQNYLAELAESTGGVLIANTNDARSSLQHAIEDARLHYEITYTPKIPQYDGRFRKVDVKVSRRDVRVQARNGYFALPATLADVLAPYEVPLLAAMSASPAPRAFEYRAGVFHFSRAANDVACAATLEVPLANVTFIEDRKRNVYRTHLSVLAMFKNSDGEVVAKAAKDVPYEGPLEKSAEFRKGALVWTEHRVLMPGRYTLETAVLDQEGRRTSTRAVSIFVPTPVEGLSVSSVSLVRRVDPPAGLKDAGDPFLSPGGKVTPTLADSIRSGPGAAISLYFVVYPDRDVAAKPELEIDFLREGKLIARAEPPRGEPSGEGSIPYMANSSIASLELGNYEVRVIARQGSARAVGQASFSIVP